jgi:hypothetical protein
MDADTLRALARTDKRDPKRGLISKSCTKSWG